VDEPFVDTSHTVDAPKASQFAPPDTTEKKFPVNALAGTVMLGVLTGGSPVIHDVDADQGDSGETV
jgi:hypothetical protein